MAVADPRVPDTASDAAKQFRDLSHQAEVLTEDFKKAEDDHAARQADLARATGESAQAEQVAGLARQDEETFRQQVDQFTGASYKGARMNKLSALLVSESPNDFLDRSSALDVLAKDNNEAIRSLANATDQAERAERRAQEARDRAAKAESDAARLKDEIAAKKSAMDKQVAAVKQQYGRLSSEEQGSLSGGSTNVGQLAGSGVAIQAVNAALGKQGSPYVYGAKGPSQFDCSGLVQWSYKQAGLSLPASTKTQATEGQSVSESELKPGDVIFFYSPISHNGIYIGGGNVVHAPTEGQDVKVESYKEIGDVNTIRRFAG
ncbi:NlpC/P60 family protein [Saccharopolyspora sp. SCSIO 74807]|uniref:C40 family peptidase n=1 Tax=Saccharopolyspora sp. SCSIO 74807 TaxID=3118084 RepID=UPI0030D370C9